MFAYYLQLALRSLKRNRALTAMMVLAIGLGIGASMTMITVLHVMSGDPLPGRSATLYVPILEVKPASASDGTLPDGFTWPDAMHLLRAQRANGQAAMASGVAIVQMPNADMPAFGAEGQYVTPEFFAMFGASFEAGAAWTVQQGKAHLPVVVLNAKFARKLFGDQSALGQTVRLNGIDFRVLGVLDAWHPQPAFYHQPGQDVFGDLDQFYLPLSTALARDMHINGHLSCWGQTRDPFHSDQCTWVQFWVQLGSPAEVAGYQRFLDGYVAVQRDRGRAPQGASAQLYGMLDWLARQHLVPRSVTMQLWLALGFLLVCMLSVVALLLAKFMRRSGDISVRRAMGAQRRSIFLQFGIEAGLIGAAGGLLGLTIAQLGLWSVRSRPAGYAQLAQMDVSMLAATIVFAVVASVLAGLLPAWQACRVPPALQLKTL